MDLTCIVNDKVDITFQIQPNAYNAFKCFIPWIIYLTSNFKTPNPGDDILLWTYGI